METYREYSAGTYPIRKIEVFNDLYAKNEVLAAPRY
jgi:hypothetical protein